MKKTINKKVGDKVRITKEGKFYNLTGRILSIATTIYPCHFVVEIDNRKLLFRGDELGYRE